MNNVTIHPNAKMTPKLLLREIAENENPLQAVVVYRSRDDDLIYIAVSDGVSMGELCHMQMAFQHFVMKAVCEEDDE